MPFNLQDYEPVEDRLARFWEKHPNGRIRTEILSSDEKTVVMQALVFRDAEDKLAAATGHAQETIGSTPVNRTSWVENCETSAIGRALANLGYAPKGARASREEMQKASRQDGARSASSARPSAERAPTPPKTTKSQQQKIAIAASDAGIPTELRYRITRLLFGVTSSKDVNRGDVNRLLDAFKSFSEKPDANMKYLEQWEAEHLPPSTAAQALREGVRARDRAPSPSGSSPPTAAEPGGDTITPEELEAAGQTTMSDVIPE